MVVEVNGVVGRRERELLAMPEGVLHTSFPMAAAAAAVAAGVAVMVGVASTAVEAASTEQESTMPVVSKTQEPAVCMCKASGVEVRCEASGERLLQVQ